MFNKLLTKTLSFAGFAIPLLSDIFIYIDGVIYAIADFALRGFFQIALISGQTSLYADQIKSITSRIMVLAGIYALFRLAFMLINYITNPEKVSEVSKNGSSYVKNIIVAVILLVSSTFIFEQMGNLQNLLINNHVIENIIYGANQYDETNSLSNEKNSKKFVNSVFLLFFVDSQGTCTSSNTTGTTNNFCNTYKAVASGDADVSSLTWGEQFQFTYYPIISGIAGILLIYYFVTYSISLAVRLLKLVVLQVVSPIPIITSIDPSQKGKLGKFARTYLDIWLQVFIRILTIYLAYVVCGLIADNSSFLNEAALNNENVMLLEINFLVRVVIYFGIFQGAKEIPKLLESALGMKIAPDSHGKGFGQVLAGIVGAGIGVSGGAIAGGVSGGAGGALAGALSGGFSGAAGMAGAKNVGAGIGAAIKSVKTGYGSGLTTAAAGGLAGLIGGKVDNFTGRNARIDREVTSAEKLKNSYDEFGKSVVGEYKKAHNIGDGDYQFDADYQIAERNWSQYRDTHDFANEAEVSSLNEDVSLAKQTFDNSVEGMRLRENIEKAEQELFAAGPSYDNLEGVDTSTSKIQELQSKVDQAKLEYDKGLMSDSSYSAAATARDNYMSTHTGDRAELERLTTAMKDARNSYDNRIENAAFADFQSKITDQNGNVDISELERKNSNPETRIQLTESERKYLEISRQTSDFVPTSDKTLQQVFKEQQKAAGKTLNIAKEKQKDPRYKSAKEVEKYSITGKR